MFRATFGHAAIRQDASLDGHGDELGASRGDAPVTKNPSSHAAAALVVTPFRSSQACREVFHSSHPAVVIVLIRASDRTAPNARRIFDGRRSRKSAHPSTRG
jgi:hypothetical protein